MVTKGKRDRSNEHSERNPCVDKMTTNNQNSFKTYQTLYENQHTKIKLGKSNNIKELYQVSHWSFDLNFKPLEKIHK